MRRLLVPALLACLAGCSNAPVAGFLDAVAPSRGRGGPLTEGPPPVLPDVRPGPRPDPLPPAADVIPPVGPSRGP